MTSAEDRRLRAPDIRLDRFYVTSRRKQGEAIVALQGEINRWFEEQGSGALLRRHAILTNKLMYFAERAIQDDNPQFKIDTGWYMYGPCYEAGRAYERGETPQQTFPVAERCSDQVAKVCLEISSLWDKAREASTGFPFANFVGLIYSKKCDHEELRRYYCAKHEVQTAFHVGDRERGTVTDQSTLDSVLSKLGEFDKALLDGEYSSYVGLPPEEVDSIVEATPFLAEYAELAFSGKKTPEFRQEVDRWIERVLTGTAHLTYARTFDSYSANHNEKVKARHRRVGDEVFSTVPHDVGRLAEVSAQVG